MPVSHAVLPIDFSERSAGAARYAEALARLFRTRISVLHVLTPPHYELGAMEVGGAVLEELFQNRREQARKELDGFLAGELPAAARVLLEGDPAMRIVEYAHDQQADLIVMPTHGYGPFRRFVLGSVTAKVLHDADCPVWTGVHLEPASADAVRFKTVAAAVDLGQQSERTLMWAARFAAEVKARLLLLHAAPDLEGKAGEYFDASWRAHVLEQVRAEAGDMQARLGTAAELLVEHGPAATAVCEMATRAGADLLVIGRGSAAGVFGRLRANAYSIIRQAPCPVVSV